MKINKAPGIDNAFDDDLLTDAFAVFTTIKTITILRELVEGKTKASVLLVDIVTERQTLDPADSKNELSGQFILKLDHRARDWPDEPVEADRHLQAEVWDETGFFAKTHIPRLRHSFERDGALVLVYDVAGLSQLRLAGYQNLGGGVHAQCCSQLSTSLLNELNRSYQIEAAVSAKQSLADWLGYRLDPYQGKRLHEFAAIQTSNKRAFTDLGRVYLNPLWVCNLDVVAQNNTHTRFLGLQHGDLHTANIFFDRAYPTKTPFWIIDWALSRPCPLLFDHAYFEISVLINELSGKSRERIATLLDAADSDEGRRHLVTVPQEHMALAASMTALRTSIFEWQNTKEPHRYDPFSQQWLLARIAAGLNWANKPLNEGDRKLAFLYAAKAASDFTKLAHTREYEAALPDADTAFYVRESSVSDAVTVVSDEAWHDCWTKLGGFAESEFTYMLVSCPLNDTENMPTLGFLPWSTIIDLDPESDMTGLYLKASTILGKRRSIATFGKELLPVNYQRGTAWMMANGWPSRNERLPVSFDGWRRDYIGRIRDLSEAFRADTAPKPLKCVLLQENASSAAMLVRLIEAVDEKFGDNAEFIVIGDSGSELAKHALIKQVLPLSAGDFLQRLHHIYGAEESGMTPQLPAHSGPIDIPPDTLKHWEEDFDVLHSLALEVNDLADSGESKFLRGMPPSWRDLSIGLDVARDVTPNIISTLEKRFQEGRNFTLEFWHSPGAGGTTAALRVAWELRREYPILVLRRYSRLTADRLDAVYTRTQKPVLLIADASELPNTARQELFRTLRGARFGLLYLVRSPNTVPASILQLIDPMRSGTEVSRFFDAYSPRCQSDIQRQRLKQIANLTNERDSAYRSPFFFGLTTFEQEFLSTNRYVTAHLAGLAPLSRQALLYLALATRFSQRGLSEAFFRRLFQPALTGEIKMQRDLGPGAARLVVLGRGQVRIVHPIIAEEVLRTLIGGSGQYEWKNNLKDLCIQLIREVVATVGPYSTEGKELFEQLFIFRDQWAANSHLGRRQFSPLIEAIGSVDGQQQVLELLTEVAELEPHYWNHRGRHLIYKTNEGFDKAEDFLLKAVDLTNERDPLQFHGLGMVRRFWIRHRLKTLAKNAHSKGMSASAEMILNEVSELANDALDAFAKARELDKEDEHNYITPIQTILVVAQRICEAAGHKSISLLCAQSNSVGQWLQQRIGEAEELLGRVKQFRGRRDESDLERQCEYDLTELYGNFDQLISTWEHILDGSATQSWLRRSIAHAYLARRGRLWSRLNENELRKIVTLSEENLSFDPASESDLRTWFHAFRLLPEFSYGEALDRLQSWEFRSDSLDAHYYLYILHFLRWYSGGERDEEMIQRHLKRCSELAVGRRDNSYEWFATGPHWCPLVNSRELGGWNDQINFFNDTIKLAFIEGTISSIKRTAGTIRIGDMTRVFFVPPAHLRESEHLNAKVHFVLGFSYGRLHAWLVDLGPAPSKSPTRRV